MFSDFIELIATEDEVNEFIQIIDEVKGGKHDQYEILFDAPMVTIQPEITKVTLSEVLDDPPPDQYIETDQFREMKLIRKEKITKFTLSEVLDDPTTNKYIEIDQFRELILIWKEKLPVRFIDEDIKH